MSRPRLLDLFCGVGGCSVGYHRAGFDVVGVDLVRQHEYPFEFHLADALTFPLAGFDVIHASPPCKAHTMLGHIHKDRPKLFEPHSDLLTPMLARLAAHGGAWVVENVVGAPMPAGSAVYCGSSFGLRVRRHRLFASSVPLTAPPCDHATQGQPLGVYGLGGGTDEGRGIKVARQVAADAMGIDWTIDQSRLSQAIPPAYTEHIGSQLLTVVAV